MAASEYVFSDPFQYVRLATDDDGTSHFVDDSLKMATIDVVPSAAPMDLTGGIATAGMQFWRLPLGWDGTQHPAVARMWSVVLQGSVEIEASDGERRRFDAGDRFFLEDVTGEGHTMRPIGDRPVLGLSVKVPD